VTCRSWSREIKIRSLAFREYGVERFRISFRWEWAWRVKCTSWYREIKIRSLEIREDSIESVLMFWCSGRDHGLRDRLSKSGGWVWKVTSRSWSGDIKRSGWALRVTCRRLSSVVYDRAP
jgi:hypothetical protein